jgi:Caspase domain
MGLRSNCNAASAILAVFLKKAGEPCSGSVMRFLRPTISISTQIILLVVIFLSPSSPAFAEKRIALVVGNSNYQNVARLNNPSSDARLMADTLRALGFAIVGNGAQVDLDKAAFDNAVRTFGRQLQGAEVGLFYYAGHGLQVRGANYLVPVDANPVREADLDFELEDVGLVLRQMEGAGTRLNIVFLDACRNNPFGGRGLRALETGLAQMRAPEGTLISFATQPGSVAQDGSNGHSPFTAALARTIRKPGLGIFDALNEVGLDVKNKTGGGATALVLNITHKWCFLFCSWDINPKRVTFHRSRSSPSTPTTCGQAPANYPAGQSDTIRGSVSTISGTLATCSPIVSRGVSHLSEGGRSEVRIGNARTSTYAYLRRSVRCEQGDQRQWRHEVDPDGRRVLLGLQSKTKGIVTGCRPV